MVINLALVAAILWVANRQSEKQVIDAQIEFYRSKFALWDARLAQVELERKIEKEMASFQVNRFLQVQAELSSANTGVARDALEAKRLEHQKKVDDLVAQLDALQAKNPSLSPSPAIEAARLEAEQDMIGGMVKNNFDQIRRELAASQ